MSSSQSWIWDVNRKQYYYISYAENCYKYQDGTQIPLGQQSIPAGPTQAQMQTQTWPGYSQPIVPQDHGYQYNQQFSHAPHSNQRKDSFLSPPNPDVTSMLQSLSLAGHQDIPQQNYIHPGYAQHSMGGHSGWPAQSSNAQSTHAGPSSAAPNLQTYGQQIIPATRLDGRYQPLDPSFKVQRPGKDFFTFGRVFKCSWPEHLGDAQDNVSFFSGTFEEIYTSQIRWFVVIAKNRDSCNCLRIQTYRRQGVAKPGVKKSDHAIVYTGKTAPEPRAKEKARGKEYGMLDPIRVKATNPREKLDVMSRLNFAKVYAVEHNVKVRNFGTIHKDSQNLLQSSFMAHMARSVGVRRNPTAVTEESDEEEEEGEEDSEEESGEE